MSTENTNLFLGLSTYYYSIQLTASLRGKAKSVCGWIELVFLCVYIKKYSHYICWPVFPFQSPLTLNAAWSCWSRSGSKTTYWWRRSSSGTRSRWSLWRRNRRSALVTYVPRLLLCCVFWVECRYNNPVHFFFTGGEVKGGRPARDSYVCGHSRGNHWWQPRHRFHLSGIRALRQHPVLCG